MNQYDPTLQDEPTIDPEFPPAMASCVIESHGEMLNGLVYVANGAGPHPTAVLLHGYPGNERNLDLAQAMRRAGWNVLFFHYRGSWGSGGTFSIMNAVADAHTAIDFLLQPENQTQFRIDPTRLTLVGHSMGGFVALLVGSQRPEISRICSIAGVNMRVLQEQCAADAEFRQQVSKIMDATRALKGHDFVGNLDAMSNDWASYDFLWNTAVYAHKSILLLAAKGDIGLPPAQHHDPVVAAFTATDEVTVAAHIMDTDHSFSGKRIALMRVVTEWLDDKT